ncbi:unnamed protein product [Larinioides sclopetarius]|uniref:Uncharacterized protein n=1 Tax=Larinioides sclopetarius TaxID=280406 RepID=A0AAV2BLU7_9ARAC
MILITRDENVDANVTNNGLTALHIAVANGNLNFIEYLIQTGANVNTISDRFSTPLHLAVRRGNLKIVEYLILNGAKINARRIDGTTPLHYAVLYGHMPVTKLLLEKGACTNAMDNIMKRTPLMFAFQYASCDMVDELLNVNGNATNQEVLGMTYLHLAAKTGHNNAVLSFLRSNSHSTDYINIRGLSGFTALHLSVLYNRLDTTKLLLKEGANLNARDNDGCTPLIIASEKGNVEIVRLLIHMKSELDSEAIGGMTALHFATLNQHEEIVDILIKSGANKLAKGIMGIAPVHIAVGTASKNIIERFLTENNTIDFQYKYFTILHLAALSKNAEIIDFITVKYSDINSVSESGFTPLHLAVKGNDINTINFLIGKQADVNLRDKYNHSSLYYAVRKNNVDVVRILIEKGALVVDEGRGEPLTSAVLYGFENIVNILLKKGHFNLNILLKNKETFLHLATRKGFENIVKILLSHNIFQNAVNARTKKGITPLHLAALRGDINIIDILLKARAKTGCKTSNNRTPLELAITNGHLHVVKYLLGQNVQGVNDRNSKGYTLLHIAAGAGKLNIVEYLLNKGANICVKTYRGKKPIHIASKEGHKDIVEFLIIKDPLQWNEVDDVNASPLVYAVIRDHLNVLKCIMQNADSDIINVKLSMDMTPLHLCVLSNLVDMLELLLENGACVTDTDAFNRKPLDIEDQMRPVPKEIQKREHINRILVCTEYLYNAIIDESIEDVRICLLGGASVNAKVFQLTPLHCVAENGNEEIADILLTKKANPNVLDADGLTPLHYSCDSSHIQIVKKLLSHGAIYNPLSTHNETPRDFAGNLDIINLLDLIDNLFTKVKDPSSSVLPDISILDDVSTVKAVMSAKNRENKTIIILAIEHNFPEVSKLKEIFQKNIQNEYRLANIYYQLEKYELSIWKFRNVLNSRETILGPNNPGTLDIKQKIANALLGQHRYREALRMFHEIFEKRKKYQGLTCSDTLDSFSGIPFVLQLQGRNREAIKWFLEISDSLKFCPNSSEANARISSMLNVLKENEKALDIKLSETNNNNGYLHFGNNMALVLCNKGKHEVAIEKLKMMYEKKRISLGPTHPSTLRTWRDIGIILSSQKNTKEAIKIFHMVFHLQTTVLGKNHFDTLVTNNCIGDILLAEGKPFKALKIYTRGLPVRKYILGPEHPDIIDTEKKIEYIKCLYILESSAIDINFMQHHSQHVSLTPTNFLKRCYSEEGEMNRKLTKEIKNTWRPKQTKVTGNNLLESLGIDNFDFQQDIKTSLILPSDETILNSLGIDLPIQSEDIESTNELFPNEKEIQRNDIEFFLERMSDSRYLKLRDYVAAQSDKQGSEFSKGQSSTDALRHLIKLCVSYNKECDQSHAAKDQLIFNFINLVNQLKVTAYVRSKIFELLYILILFLVFYMY